MNDNIKEKIDAWSKELELYFKDYKLSKATSKVIGFVCNNTKCSNRK